jgi:hypothetical protein
MGHFRVSACEAKPHLKLLDNKRARRLFKLLERRQPLSVAGAGLGVLLLMSLNWLGARAAVLAFQFDAALRGFDIDSGRFQVLSAAATVILMLPSPITCMLVRDWWFRRMVQRRAIKRDCVLCSYPLASLEGGEASVCCPECGTNHKAVGCVMLPAMVLEG